MTTVLPDVLTPNQRRRSLAAVIASAAVAGVTIGFTIPLVALLLERDGASAFQIGLTGGAASLAILVVGPLVPRLLDALGVLPALALAVTAGVAVLLVMPLWSGVGPWFVLRFLAGAFGAVHWIVSETWILSLSERGNRGRILSVYMTFLAAGFASGPLLINLIGIDGWTPFLVGAALIGASGLPLVLARGCAPRLPRRAPAAVSAAFRATPLVMAAAALGGFTDTALFSLLPVYGLQRGLGTEQAVLLLSVMLVGNLALQIPLGVLADHVDRRRLLIACGVVFLLGPLALPFVLGSVGLQWPLLVIWGAASMGIYTVGLTLLGDRFDANGLAGANAAFVTVYEAGSVLGPVVSGSAMDGLGADGLMVVLALAALAFLGLTLWRALIGR